MTHKDLNPVTQRAEPLLGPSGRVLKRVPLRGDGQVENRCCAHAVSGPFRSARGRECERKRYAKGRLRRPGRPTRDGWRPGGRPEPLPLTIWAGRQPPPGDITHPNKEI